MLDKKEVLELHHSPWAGGCGLSLQDVWVERGMREQRVGGTAERRVVGCPSGTQVGCLAASEGPRETLCPPVFWTSSSGFIFLCGSHPITI